jgi:hypothetical protein
MEEFVKEIDERINTSFKVTNIPISLLKEFKSFCKTECGDVYWVGIFQLMKLKKEYSQLLPLLSNLQNQINELKSSSQSIKSKEVKTFRK